LHFICVTQYRRANRQVAALDLLYLGEIFSLFASLCIDTFGLKFAAWNATCLCTAKGAANVLRSGRRMGTVYISAGIANVTVALPVLAVLQSFRRQIITGARPELSAAMR
jgi:OFA family oxalate/formate antiporter-like MFS transporter